MPADSHGCRRELQSASLSEPCRFADPATHDDGRIGTGAAKFGRGFHRIGYGCAIGAGKSELRKILLGCGGQQVELVDTSVFRSLEELLDKPPADPASPLSGT